ncbi:MAG: hypothetical protein A3J24_08550 [Deltaproteobacteria bacterium RIFCSPLOWO2_02_FULL_53_8]|nr:MAG: hypothetical protein A3J24_08550 [Deltaproteobacteria bacterium RIFCSPLOWO2_02_FULL_53_8]
MTGFLFICIVSLMFNLSPPGFFIFNQRQHRLMRRQDVNGLEENLCKQEIVATQEDLRKDSIYILTGHRASRELIWLFHT